MSILLYCVAPENACGVNAAGVAGAPVKPVDHDGLRFYVSEMQREALAAAHVAQSARAVHEVVMEVFAGRPVLPFRYPTLLENEQELEKLAREKGPSFQEFLSWVGPRVQMDVKLSVDVQEENRTKGPSTPES